MRVRTQTLVGEYWYIDENDPAIDKESKDWRERYERAMETGELADMPLKNGSSEPPAIFRLRHLTAREYSWLADYESRHVGPNTMFWEAIALALLGVRNVTDETGKPVEVERARQPDSTGAWQSARPDVVNILMADEDGRYDAARLTRLGNRILADRVPHKG